MTNMVHFFTEQSGRKWFICRDCGYKQDYFNGFCPVCRNEQRCTNQERLNAIALLIATEGGRKSIL
jgi:predicted ATP-dependent serine protease